MDAAEDIVDATFIKRGETPIQVSLIRNRTGLKLLAKAHPDIEQLMRTIGGGDVVDARVNGRYWEMHNDPSSAVNVYDLRTELGILGMPETPYRLDATGLPLIVGDERPFDHTPRKPVVNLSFLRLVGISDGAGVVLNIRGVYTESSIRNWGGLVREAARSFYIDYLKPIEVTVMVSTQELHP